MGSFQQTCMVSDLSIPKGKEVAVFLLTQQEDFGSKLRGNLQDNIHEHLEILSMPIFGQYDGEGNINNIEKTESVRLIEKFYALPIEDILDFFFESYDIYYPCGTFYDKYARYKTRDDLSFDVFADFIKKTNNKQFTINKEESLFTTKIERLMAGKKIPITIEIQFKSNQSYQIVSDKNNDKPLHFRDLEELCELLHVHYDLFLYYDEKVRKFVKTALDRPFEMTMVLKSVYKELISLATTDVQWYETHRFDFNQYREMIQSNINKCKETSELIVEMKNFLEKNKETLTPEEIKEQLDEINYKQTEMHITKNIYGYCDTLVARTYLERRLQYARLFSLIHGEEIAINDNVFKEFSDLMSFEIVLESLGKYYRLPGFTPQFGTQREKEYIEFLNTLV